MAYTGFHMRLHGVQISVQAVLARGLSMATAITDHHFLN